MVKIFDKMLFMEMLPQWTYGSSSLDDLQLLLQVLEIGCGNSQLSEELYKGGVTEITCIDLSAIAVEKMQKRLLSKGYKGVWAGFLQHMSPLF